MLRNASQPDDSGLTLQLLPSGNREQDRWAHSSRSESVPFHYDPGSSRMEPSHNYGMEGSITTWYFRVFLVRLRCYSVIIGTDTSNGVSGRFRYFLPYLTVFLVGLRCYSVIMGGSSPGDSGVIFTAPSISSLPTLCARSEEVPAEDPGWQEGQDDDLHPAHGRRHVRVVLRPWRATRDGSHARCRVGRGLARDAAD